MRSRAEFGLEEQIFFLLQRYYIKRAAWFGDAKLNGVNVKKN